MAGATYALSRPGYPHDVERLLARIPAVGRQLQTYQLARFYRSLGMLLRGGDPLSLR